MEEDDKFKIRDKFCRFLTKTQYLQNVFKYAEEFRFDRGTELNKIRERRPI
jgi:hypothetical protein